MSEFTPSCPADIPRLRQLWRDAFGDPEDFLDLFFSTAYAPERSLVLRLEGTVCGMCYWLEGNLGRQRFAYVYAVAIDPRLQGQGWGKKLMRTLHDRLMRLGYDAALLIPGSEELVQYYLQFGYRFASHHRRWLSTTGAPVAMEELTATEYADARQAYLPENGVVQLGENLPFLAGSARFYRGENFLAAVALRQSYCLELLGDPAQARGITAALGLERCVFRAPGGEHPYAMGKALSGKPLPRSIYFAFGFDL